MAKYRLIEYLSEIFLVVGIGYDSRFDPADVFYCVKLEDSLFKSLMKPHELIIPLSKALEITDENRLLAIWTLYGK